MRRYFVKCVRPGGEQHIPAIQQPASTRVTLGERLPPHAYFIISAIFHYLGPSFAVLLFARVAPLGVAWLRIARAALIFAVWRRPWRYFLQQGAAARWNIVALGAVLGCMNICFYLAIDRLPLGTVGAIEFLGPIALALAGTRTRRNVVALAVAVVGVWMLTRVRLAGASTGFVCAFANCALFMLYIVLGHRAAKDGGGEGIDRLAAAMLVALLLVVPFGLHDAAVALTGPGLLAAGIGDRLFVVGDSLCLRPARDGASAARHLRAPARAVARHGERDRHRGAASDSRFHRDDRHCAGHRRRHTAPDKSSVNNVHG